MDTYKHAFNILILQYEFLFKHRFSHIQVWYIIYLLLINLKYFLTSINTLSYWFFRTAFLSFQIIIEHTNTSTAHETFPKIGCIYTLHALENVCCAIVGSNDLFLPTRQFCLSQYLYSLYTYWLFWSVYTISYWESLLKSLSIIFDLSFLK